MNQIRAARPDDAACLSKIYNFYVDHSIVTFEEQPVPVDDFAERIRVLSGKLPWLVSQLDGDLTGFAYASPWKSRQAYRYSVETTIYLAPDQLGQGLGKLLYTELIKGLRKLGVHSLIAGIAQPNPVSATLHEKLGYRKIGEFEQVGYKFDRWIDVHYWELLLD